MEVWESLLENCNTATLQRQPFQYEKKIAEKRKISYKIFVNRNGNVVTLHRESVKGQKTKGKRQRLAITTPPFHLRCESVVNPL